MVCACGVIDVEVCVTEVRNRLISRDPWEISRESVI